MRASVEPIVGRYVRCDIEGRPHRVYFEEAGEGIPLLCLHTAGSDGRQYRALLNDEAVTKDFRVVAYDMPWHGKSSPPAGWQDETYQLTSAAYVRQVLAIVDALELDRPVVMGCSIGGRVVLHLAHEHPERFRALIGLQSSAHVDRYYDTSWLGRPDVGGETYAGCVSGLVAPTSPPEHGWETLWHYMQGGPGVFGGDLHFYNLDGDIRPRIDEIDPARCPIFLLTGEYDFSCTPDATRDVARRIGDVEPVIMKDMGHFPMSENPAAFRTHLLPVLDRILALADGG
ncbi:alpha/beta fold hydrolase [Acuticoccus sp.]|uniref:alpha/beta fold hydrolase n=1 Tax=Acuticoccus sp. TaxID=1904378 RepID=UPI003B52A820